MSIIKNEITILEFDSEQSAVINPTHEGLDIQWNDFYTVDRLAEVDNKNYLQLRNNVLV